MLYTCQHCGARFPSERLREATKNNDRLIHCDFCNLDTELGQMSSSHTTKGYDFLDTGSFYFATQAFSEAIKYAQKIGKEPSADAYIGYALAQFRVQAIFNDEDSEKFPELICHQYNSEYFADCDSYIKASQAIKKLGSEYGKELDRLEQFKDNIDKIKEYYDNIKAENPANFRYGVFIAYEEDPDVDMTGNRGYEIADRVRNSMPDEIKNIYLPDIYEIMDSNPIERRLKYEASILYALDHSNCMLVITDNDIDSRLIHLYSRYYFNEKGHGKGGDHDYGNNLGFVRYCGHINIALPDQTIAERNVFDVDSKSEYISFVRMHNGIYQGNRTVTYMVDGNVFTTQRVEEGRTCSEPDVAPTKSGYAFRCWSSKPDGTAFDFTSPILKDYVLYACFGNQVDTSTIEQSAFNFLPTGQIVFGEYPQRRDTSENIENYFESLPKPDFIDNNGWTVMFTNRIDMPFTWYRDEVIDGKKYRGVYFMKYRDVYSVQKSDLKPKEQLIHGYTPMRVYCFAFEPIVWDVEEESSEMAVLVANQGLDSREYSNCTEVNEWCYSYIRQWLNEEFYNTAFTDEQKEYLCMLGGSNEEDKVFLLDEVFDKGFYSNEYKTVRGSDYFRCIGGMGDRSVNSYWIKSDNCQCDFDTVKQACVVYPSNHNGTSKTYVDSTVVAVIPKVYLRFKINKF